MVTEMQRSTALRSKEQRSPVVTGGRNLVVEDLGQEDMEMDLAETEEPCKVPVRDSSQHDETMGDAGPAVVSDHLHPPPPPPPPPPSLTPPTDSSKTQQSPPKVTAKEHRRRCLDAVLTKLSLSPNILSLIPEPDKLNEVERILKLWYRGVGGDFLEGSIYSAVVQHALLSDGSAKKYNAVLKAADRRKWAKGRGRAKSGKPLQEKE